MASIVERKLIWWRDVPIDVEIGLLMYLSDNWKNDIYIICTNDYESSRTQCAWNVESFGNVHMLNGNLNQPENRKLIEQLLNEDTVNIFSGVRGGHRIFLDKLRAKHNSRCVVVMESTSLYGSKLDIALKSIAYPIVYGWYYKKYKSVIKGLFTMGEDAVKQYFSYGWKNIFDFMYLPKLKKVDKIISPKSGKIREMRMLYIGRFDFPTKGLHILMDAVDQIQTSASWHMDMVGGYGDQKDEVLNWCKEREHVSFIGSWDSGSVVENMANYDFCIVPSLYDGWNLTPLQALYAGVGCIVTNRAGSQELVQNSGAGAVIIANDSNVLSKTICRAVENHDLVEQWKTNAKKYVDRVSVENVGDYFLQGLKYCYGEIEKRPECPW